MRIVLCCAGGLSTTMLMNSMKDTVHNSAKLNDADFDFIAIPIDILQSEADNCDVLVLGPQVAHKLDAVKPIIEPRKIPYVIVDQETYGKMDGATVMKQALIARRKADLKNNFMGRKKTMYSKFENFMKKYLAPLADKMDKEVHLSAVKKQWLQ